MISMDKITFDISLTFMTNNITKKNKYLSTYQIHKLTEICTDEILFNNENIYIFLLKTIKVIQFIQNFNLSLYSSHSYQTFMNKIILNRMEEAKFGLIENIFTLKESNKQPIETIPNDFRNYGF